MFASEYWKEEGVMPDILATAKSIGAGLPLSAIVAREEIMESVLGGTIGGTYCGNPLACAAAIKTIEIMERDNFAKRSLEIGEKVQKKYREWMEKYDVIGDVRGLGGMIGMEFVTDKESKNPNTAIVSEIIEEAVQNGLMLENSGTCGQVIRFLAPLVMTDEQLEEGLKIFERAIEKFSSKN